MSSRGVCLYYFNYTWWSVLFIKLNVMLFYPTLFDFVVVSPNFLFLIFFSDTLCPFPSLKFNDKVAHLSRNSSNIIIMWCYPKVSGIWILRANSYAYIEIPLYVSSNTYLGILWPAASSWAVRFIVGERISINIFPWVCGFAMADMRESDVSV
jgi:hypothetical protein